MTDLQRTARRDLAIMVGTTIAFGLLSMKFDLSERLLRWTHAGEWAQLDEWPQILLVFTLCLAWFAGRRLRDARAEIQLRRSVEGRLADALQEIRRLGQRGVDIQEAERRALARELHDELGQYLVALRIDACAIRDDTQGCARQRRAATESILRHVEHMHASVRDIIGRLRPAGLDELGLVAALENLVQAWRARLPAVTIALEVHDLPDPPGEAASLALYRLVQECLVNLSRHAQAATLQIRLWQQRDPAGLRWVHLLARDDGAGCPPDALRKGFGLAGMRERVQSFGGEFAVETAPGAGFCVRARIGLDALPA